MSGKLFALLFIIIALLLAGFASILPQDRLASIIYITRFFDIMLPVLAVGALIKYLFSCHHHWHRPVNDPVTRNDTVTRIETR
ncbi:MAG: hypothetical protein H0U71_09110 [Gammaproteobacteria bacterium]|nr:hypothetical protein [Gammaproteobacteria bacterium]